MKKYLILAIAILSLLSFFASKLYLTERESRLIAEKMITALEENIEMVSKDAIKHNDEKLESNKTLTKKIKSINEYEDKDPCNCLDKPYPDELIKLLQ